MTEEQLFAAIRESIRSVWELEVLLLLHRSLQREWTLAELERELRASPVVIGDAVKALVPHGFIAEAGRGAFQYQPRDEQRAAFVEALERIYAIKPVSVVKAIISAPNRRLRSFSDAFRFRG